jgi:hypothetical protein
MPAMTRTLARKLFGSSNERRIKEQHGGAAAKLFLANISRTARTFLDDAN